MRDSNTFHRTADQNSPLRGNQRLALRMVLVVTLVLLTGIAITSVASGDPTVSVENSTTAPNETTTVGVTLSEAPNGVAGYEITVSVSDQTAVAVTDVSVSDSFGLRSTNQSNNQVTLVASDTNRNVEPNATNITLGTLTLSGLNTGQTALPVQVTQFDDDAGNPVNATTRAGTVVVESGMSDGGDNKTDNGTDDGTGDNGTDDNGTDDGTDDGTGDDETDDGTGDDGADDNGTDDGMGDDGADDNGTDDGTGDDRSGDGTGDGFGISQMGVVFLIILGTAVGYLWLQTGSDDDGPGPPQ